MTVISLAAVASTTALGTAAAIAGGTPPATIVADVVLAALADEGLVAVVAAVLTPRTGPVLQLHIGAAGVVGLQHLPHEQEEVAQPPLLQRLANRHAAVSLAKLFGTDVRMSHVAVALGGVLLLRDDAVRHRGIHIPPIQHDLKRAKVDLFERDRLRHDRQRPLLPVPQSSSTIFVGGQRASPVWRSQTCTEFSPVIAVTSSRLSDEMSLAVQTHPLRRN